MSFLRHIIRGCRDLPGYGPHPGTMLLITMTLAGGLAGIEKGGLRGFIGGCLFALFFILPMYLGGAYSRSKDCDRDQAALLRKIDEA